MYSRTSLTLNPCDILSAWTNKIFNRKTTAVVVLCAILSLYWAYSHQWLSSKLYTGYTQVTLSNARKHASYDDFLKTWCRVKRARVDWESILQPCADNMEWGKNKKYWSAQNRTNAMKCYLTLWDIRPVGQFSRFGIQSVTNDNKQKSIGGDSWRVHIRGPSSLSPTVIDHNNGTYEILFLVLEPGKYDVEVVLEHSLCDGYKDPPKDWFINGNAQGRYQHPRSLPGYDRPFLASPLWGGAPFIILIPPSFDLLFHKAVDAYGSFDACCGINCTQIQDGFGRWVGVTWRPYNQEIEVKETKQKEALRTVLWIYGDSVGDLFFKSIVKQPLCTKIFKICNNTYNWVYKIPDRNLTRARIEIDNLDFSMERVLTEILQVATKPFMDENSVILLNLGLHYVHTINFTTYMKLIDKTIKLLKEEFKTDQSSWKFKGKFIWKTTTAINMEKYGDPRTSARHSTNIRFLTHQRVLLFNAYAIYAMCEAGVEILDVYPISDSYPEGTGLPYKPYDAVHYKPHVFQPVINSLQTYLGNK